MCLENRYTSQRQHCFSKSRGGKTEIEEYNDNNGGY